MEDVVLKFPSFEKIKELPLLEYDEDWLEEIPVEYNFPLFNIYYGLCCRIKYNEEGSNKLMLDITDDGYICEEYHFDVTEDGYESLKSRAESIYNDAMRMLVQSNDGLSYGWFKTRKE